MSIKVSITTVCQSATLESVGSQTGGHIEHVVVDGNSNDGTRDIIKKTGNRVAKFVSEPDKSIYDATKKGGATSNR